MGNKQLYKKVSSLIDLVDNALEKLETLDSRLFCIEYSFKDALFDAEVKKWRNELLQAVSLKGSAKYYDLTTHLLISIAGFPKSKVIPIELYFDGIFKIEIEGSVFEGADLNALLDQIEVYLVKYK